jgi:hypothetical protein
MKKTKEETSVALLSYNSGDSLSCFTIKVSKGFLSFKEHKLTGTNFKRTSKVTKTFDRMEMSRFKKYIRNKKIIKSKKRQKLYYDRI